MSDEKKWRPRDLGTVDWSQCKGLWRDPGRMSGAWCFDQTRMPVSCLLINLGSGMTIEEWDKVFPGVGVEPARVVLDFLARRADGDPAEGDPDDDDDD